MAATTSTALDELVKAGRVSADFGELLNGVPSAELRGTALDELVKVGRVSADLGGLLNGVPSAAIAPGVLERAASARAFAATLCCAAGHAMVPNEDVEGRSFPVLRNYGACDICESRGTRFRCQACDYDLCWSAECAAAVPPPPPLAEGSALAFSLVATALACLTSTLSSRL